MLGCNVGVMTEPECLGPCDPGTSVNLEAVIWHENTGMLVVNVKWKGRKYVGTLLDATVHEWAPPSFKPGSPVKIQEPPVVQSSPQKRRTRRGRGGAKNKPQEIVYSVPRTWGGDFKPYKHSTLDPSAESIRPDKRARCDIECPEEKCSKKFRCQNALEYHRIHAHVQNEIAVMTPAKSSRTQNAAKKETRGIQTQTCSELQSKSSTQSQSAANLSAATSVTPQQQLSTTVNSINSSSLQTMLTNKDNKAAALPQENVMTNNKAIAGTVPAATDVAAAKVMQQSNNHISGSSMARLNPAANQTSQSHVIMAQAQGTNNMAAPMPNASNAASIAGSQPRAKMGGAVGVSSPQRSGPIISGTVRPMMSTKIDNTSAKKVNAPVAVLRPLVPQHVLQKSTDKTIASITTPTHTLTISSSQPQYRTVPIPGAVASVSSTPRSTSKSTTAGGNTMHKPHSSSHKNVPQQSQFSDMIGGKHKQVTNGPSLESQKGHEMGNTSGLLVGHRRDSGKSSNRGSRSNSMNSPNYSDISDASDADMDTNQSDDGVPRQNGDGNDRGDVKSAEERLYCNEELPSPSNTPGMKDNDARSSPLKSQHAVAPGQHQPQQQQQQPPPRNSPAPPSNKQQQPPVDPRQSVPLPAVHPHAPQHIMYPYFPFMPNSQMNHPGVPMSAGAPMYAAPPYFMAYQGLPFMPGQGPPGMQPHQVAPGQAAFVAAAGNGNATNTPPQPPKMAGKQ